MKNAILDYFANTNTPFLHAHAEMGTEELLKALNIQNADSILEIGFGTGSTLVKIKSRYPSVKLFGVDRSALMKQKANARLKFCGLNGMVTLQLAAPDGSLPFETDIFDKVYLESVLAIQDGKDIDIMLSEIFRVLKKGGKLIFNETVWLPSITDAEIEAINSGCKKAFGIIQSSGKYRTASEWVSVLQKTGFRDAVCRPVEPKPFRKDFNIHEFLSGIFTSLGRWRGRLKPHMRLELKQYQEKTRDIYANKQYMEGILFTAFK